VTDSDGSARAMHHAVEVARASGATLHVVAASEAGSGESGAQRLLAELEAEATAASVRFTTHPVTVDPAQAITQVAAASGADLIVVGSPSSQGARRLSRVPQQVMDDAPCAVMLV